MNYKIILKKKRNEDINESLEKTYHSCVDLLSPSSLSNIDLASGDIIRFISDTFIISAVTANFCNDEKKEKIFSQHVYDSNNNETEKYDIKDTIVKNGSYSMNKELIDEALSVSIKDIEEKNRTVTLSAKAINITCEDDETQYEAIEDTKPQNNESVCLTNYISTRKEVAFKRKLSVTPICSVDTTDSLTNVPETKSLHTFTLEYVNLRQINNQSLYNLNSRSQDLQKNNVSLHKHINNMETVPSFVFNEDRERPEVKVAKFVKKMESEIMPLRVMLNDILRKCFKLGLMNKNNTLNKPECIMPTVNHNVSTNINVNNVCWKEVQPKSNRVVYSVVFDT